MLSWTQLILLRLHWRRRRCSVTKDVLFYCLSFFMFHFCFKICARFSSLETVRSNNFNMVFRVVLARGRLLFSQSDLLYWWL